MTPTSMADKVLMFRQNPPYSIPQGSGGKRPHQKLPRALLIATGVCCVIGVALLVVCLFIRLSTSLAIPGWSTYASGLIIIILLQTLSITVSFAFSAFSDLGSMACLPVRDYIYFLDQAQGLPLSPESLSDNLKISSSPHV